MKTNNPKIQELLNEKGDLSISELSLNEFKEVLHYLLLTEHSILEDNETLINSTELIEKLNISTSTFYKMKARRHIPQYIVGSKPMFILSEVLKVLKVKNINIYSSSQRG
jgi:predicted DNA-binding transcriptional regulator AlpA